MIESPAPTPEPPGEAKPPCCDAVGPLAEFDLLLLFPVLLTAAGCEFLACSVPGGVHVGAHVACRLSRLSKGQSITRARAVLTSFG